jgi:hypothetical protein
MEVELTKSKMDLLTMNGQLMEAIQQKVALSQELDQWQVGEIIISNGLDFEYRKRPYITRIDALSAPLFAPQTWGEKNLDCVYNPHRLLICLCGGQKRE